MIPKSVMMIGGGRQEIEAVLIAQSMGLKVIVTDRSLNAPCFQYSDYTAVIDGRDIESLIAYTLLNKEKLNISGVFTLTELVTSVAAVASSADLPGVSVKSSVACQNKQLCKEIWRKTGIPTPDGGVINSYEEAERMYHKLGGDVFLKPVIGFGGQNSGRIVSTAELKSFFKEDSGYCKTYIMEKYICGLMYDVNGLIMQGGVFQPLGIVQRKFLDNWPVEIEISTPTFLSQNEQNDLYSLLESGVRTLGINFGPVKGDAVLTDSGFMLLEVAPRLHGPKNSIFLMPMSGLNPLITALNVITNNDIPINNICSQYRYALCRAILPNRGKIKSIDGIEKARKLPGVEHIMIFVKKDNIINYYQNSTHVPGYVFAAGKSYEECNNIVNKALSIIKIIT